MGPERRRQLIALALFAAIAVFGWSYFGTGRQAPAATQRGGGERRSTQGGSDALPPAEEVRLGALAQQRGEPSAATRNPFKFDRRPRGSQGLAEDVTPAIPAPAAPVEPPAPTGPPPPPPIPLKFIGVLEKTSDGLKWAVLSVGDGRSPLYGKEGDIIDGRYRILKIGTESIDMVYLDGRGRQTIRLTGQ